MSWINHIMTTPINQLHWWEMVLFGLAWFGVAVVIYFYILGLEMAWRRVRRRRRR